MPKPSFMQRALGQPTRSYADPYAASPWADPYDDPPGHVYGRPSHYQPIVDRGAHLGYKERDRRRDGPAEAGPSRPRRAVSTVSDHAPRPSSSLSTRFLKPARKVTSTVELRETVIVERGRIEDQERPVRGDTVRRKKAKAKRLDEYSEASSSPGMPFTSASTLRRMKNASINDDNSSLASDPSATSLPPPLRPRAHASDSSSARSSTIPPVTPAILPRDARVVSSEAARKRRPSASVLQPNVLVTHMAPLTPPESESSLRTLASSDQGRNRAPRTSPLRPESEQTIYAPPPRIAKQPEDIYSGNGAARQRAPSPAGKHAGSDSEEEVFYTPRQSLELGTQEQLKETLPVVVEPELPTTRPVAPVLSLQPPTPAAVEDLASSPLHDNESPTGKIQASLINLAPAIDSPPIEDDERHSIHPEVGSDSEDEVERSERSTSRAASHTRQASRSQPHSRTPSFSLAARPASRTGSMVILQSQRTSMLDDRRGPHLPPKAKTTASPSIDGQRSNSSSRGASPRGMGEFKVFRRGSAAVSERSFGIRSDAAPASGYGKGGWAAAHASSRSIAAPSPVKMMMPSGANDGWAEHQVPLRSNFTPLPPASQAATFENLRLGEELAAAEFPDDGYSSPSEYSRMSDGEDLPKPSRSYAKASQSSHSYDRSSDGSPGASGDAYASRDYISDSPGSSMDPYAPYRDRRDTIRADSPHLFQPQAGPKRDSRPPSAMQRYSRSSSSGNASGSRRLYSRENSYQSRSTPPSGLSRPTSPAPSQPPSPPMSRPGSPMSINTQRGFEAPSFLNPDTLTLLPEMSIEDSSRTYVADPLGDARRKADAIRRTRSSIYSKSVKSAHSVKSARSDDEDDVGDLPPRRAKSAMGHRPDLSRWEGSSAGEGVLVQSDGLDQPNTGGYTTLILPTGAYQPTDPSKSSASEINSRILGLPHATMAALVLSSSTHRLRSDTPAHLRNQLPPPVDFSSHLKPPTKVSDSQVLVQVYAVAIDGFDLAALDVKSRADVGKWVPGRSFVGRCLQVGSYEKELVRGDLVMGLMDVRKSGALAEYIICDRRRLARTPFPSQLTLEQMSLLPLQGLPTMRAIRGRLARQTRALICDPHRGVTALMCQELSRAGTHVTALIAGGDDHHSAQSFCMLHGAKGVLTGRPATVMNQLEEGVFDLVIDTQGGQWIYDAAKRVLKDGGKLITLVPPEQAAHAKPENIAKPSGLKSLRAAFSSSKRQTSKTISFEYLPPAGSGEAEVDSSGLDIRDVLEEPTIVTFKPVVTRTVPLEKGNEAFRGVPEGVVVRIIH